MLDPFRIKFFVFSLWEKLFFISLIAVTCHSGGFVKRTYCIPILDKFYWKQINLVISLVYTLVFSIWLRELAKSSVKEEKRSIKNITVIKI